MAQLKEEGLPVSAPDLYQMGPVVDLQRIPISVIRNVLSMYKESLYGIWPLLATEELIERLESKILVLATVASAARNQCSLGG